MRLPSLSTVVLAAVLVSADRLAFRGCQNKVKESIVAPPRGWVRHGPAPQDQVVRFKIALAQPSFSKLEEHLLASSDPAHEHYGMHLSKEEAHALMAPSQDSIDVVSEWLAEYGIGEEYLHRSAAKDWITIHVPVSMAEDMFDTRFHVYKHVESEETFIRTTQYSLPSVLHDHVELVQPTTMYARFKPMRSTLHYMGGITADIDIVANVGNITGPAGNLLNATCNYEITLDCLHGLYNTGNYVPSGTNGNKLAVTGYLDEYANFEDFQHFLELENPIATGTNFSVVAIHGGQNNQTLSAAGVEANLDVQFAFGMAYPIPGTFYTTGGEPPYTPDKMEPTNTNEPYADWLDYIMNQTDIPQTISTSYGDNEQTVPPSYAERVCKGFAALGARGISVLFSSGDGGVGDNDENPATTNCTANNGTNAITFLPGFPASCPYVTAVGATVHIPEVAANFSGGGFSNYFARPAYQDSVVKSYLSSIGSEYAGLFNSTGRAYPDVSAQGVNYVVFYRGAPVNVSGTSCSSPAFASLVSMLNDARIAANMSTLGFLNPFLYSNGFAALNDITEGNNPGCGTQGFKATKGWDPVTGLGTPNFEKLKDLVLGKSATD